jgi:hypothetical protein
MWEMVLIIFQGKVYFAQHIGQTDRSDRGTLWYRSLKQYLAFSFPTWRYVSPFHTFQEQGKQTFANTWLDCMATQYTSAQHCRPWDEARCLGCSNISTKSREYFLDLHHLLLRVYCRWNSKTRTHQYIIDHTYPTDNVNAEVRAESGEVGLYVRNQQPIPLSIALRMWKAFCIQYSS